MYFKKNKICINPSILAANCLNLESEIKKIKNADFLHIDIMDNHFVPNIAFGFFFIEYIQEITDIPLDIHLMINNVENFIQSVHFKKINKNNLITFHIETSSNPLNLINELRLKNMYVGLAICPNTSLDLVFNYLNNIDTLLIMTVHPGFGGQRFLPNIIDKIYSASSEIKKRKLSKINLQVDGGVTDENISRIATAGANSFVAGTFIFNKSIKNNKKSQSPHNAIEYLRQIAVKNYIN